MPAGEAVSNAARVAAEAGEAEAGARSVNDLALDLLRLNSGTDRGNVALSPWSIATALAMTRVGARGATLAEMDHVLHVADRATYDQSMNALDRALRSRNQTVPWGRMEALIVHLSAANRLFAQSGLELRAEFLDVLAARYGAGVGEVDYVGATELARQAINEWVADETRRRIPELIPMGVLDSTTRLVLANVVYLHADWATPFDPRGTSDRTFHGTEGDVTVPFMSGTDRWGWSEGDGWRAVELPYVGGDVAMTFVVPDAGQFDRLMPNLDLQPLERLTTTHPARVRLRLPKFDIDRSVMLGAQLRSLGMPLAFSDAADLSGITTDEALSIAEVVHQANVTVDEQGTVAAAATGVVAHLTKAFTSEPKELDVDRPFLFLLRDRPTGALLFAGQVTSL